MIDWSVFSIEDYERLVLAFVKQHYPVEFKDAEAADIVAVTAEEIKFTINDEGQRLVLTKTSLEYLIPGLIGRRLDAFTHLDDSKTAVVLQMQELCRLLEDHLQLWRTIGSGAPCGHGIGAALNNAKKNLEFFSQLYCN
jgi:hypothetical protein